MLKDKEMNLILGVKEQSGHGDAYLFNFSV